MAGVLFWALPSLAAADSETVSPELIQQMNRRYDDFFIQRQAKERLDEQRQKNAANVGSERRAREAAREKARLEYVHNHERVGEDELLRKKWEAAEADRREEQEMSRRRYVKHRDQVDDLRRRGRTVPELKEYDLEDY